jgi:pyruvate/2-oxoglutarate dehydrogenase complex dihydrolipoamide acyltransferase (E2) component
VLVIALLVTRRHDAAEDEQARAAATSFLDEAPTDTLSRLGKAEQQTVTAPPSSEPAEAERRDSSGPTLVAAAGAAAQRNNGDLSLDWGPSGGGATPGLDDDLLAPEPDDAETTGELPAIVLPDVAQSVAAAETAAGADAAGAPTPERATGLEAAADQQPGRRVPLSDIIVTTSSKMVDVDDPEVRHMLTDLVTFEIDQATQYRQQGQDIDAVLQLTEAEKISRALGLDETAERIREMMADLHA